MAVPKTKPLPLSEKFDILMRREMRTRLVEMDDEIEIFLLALVAKQHACFIGSPGIAKSFLVETGISLIDDLGPSDYFHTLMMKSTTPEAIFGPLMLSLLKEDRYVFMPDGFLPSAKIAFLSEAWKANNAILNALLWATNERLYRNDGKVIDLPLWSMFIDSNEFPQGDELNAIYDRFILRRVVQPIQEPGNFVSMLKLAPAPIVPAVTWAEVEQAHKEMEAVTVPNDVLEALADIKSTLKEKSILPSDRRFKKSLDIVKAAAWLKGFTEADIEHLRPLRHVLWTDEAHINEVDGLMIGLSNPIDLEIMDIMKGLSQVSIEVERTISDPGDRDLMRRACTAQFGKVEEAMGDLKKINARLKGSSRRSEKLETAKEQVLGLIRRLLTKGFEMSEQEIEDNNLATFSDLDGD